MFEKAYGRLEIKAVDLEERIIEGFATTPTTDLVGDIVDPAGAEYTLPMPLLWQHDLAQPVGEVFAATVTREGIAISAKFAKVDEPGALHDRLEDAWQSVKAKLVRGFSIGFKPLSIKPLTRGRHIARWLWAETSAVTIPMNLEATIRNIKSAAQEARPMQTYSEQITALENSRAAALATMTDLMGKAAETGVTLDPGQAVTYDEQETRVKSIDADLSRVRALEAFNVKQATPVVVAAPALTPRPSVVQVRANVPKGTAFVRKACALLICNGNTYEAAEYASRRWNDSTPEVALSLKAAVAPGTTTDATWAQPLVNQNISSEFLELLRPATVVGKIPGLRNVPFNVKVPSQTAGGVYNWVGEQKPKPVTSLAFSAETLGVNKIAGIIVLTEELVRLSNPSAEALVKADMIAGIAQFIDQQFLDPAKAAVAGVSPASITNGAATAAATTNPMADIMGLINHFATNNISVDGLTFILSASNALALSFRTNLDGSPQYPGISMNGGTYKGLTFITSNVATTNVVALQPALILFADDGGVTIDASREASLQMDSAPASPADATTVMVSLWQMNCVGLRAERFITWKRVGTNAVKYLTATAWPAPSGAGFAADEPPADGPLRKNGR